MTRAAITVLVLVLAGCRPPTPPIAETRAQQPQPKAALAQPASASAAKHEPELPELVAVERAATSHVVPPGVGASETACEQSCGEVHDCALLERKYTPAAAAAIELGCVRTCMSTSERATLFGCGRPAAIEPGTCAAFLACVGTAWPHESESGSATATPPVVVRADPCARVCEAFTRCWDPTTPPELTEQCAVQCREVLDAEQESEFERCADLPECADIMACVAETPGA